jgi:membrane protein implicated in regulation of membrane protease activity
MHGLLGAIGRLLVMGLVMAAVLAGSVFAGLATTTAIAIGIVVAGVVGLLGVARRGRTPRQSAHDEIAAMMAPRAPVTAPVSQRTSVEAMAPQTESPVDPEAGVPRWRRPSLIEARHSDYNDRASARAPMLFGGDQSDEAEVRVVRYAVVPVLDRPDEVLGVRQTDLASGDEVQVVGAAGAFLEVLCPNGDRGWVHRTTLGQPGGVGMTGNARRVIRQDADDALTALLTARGLI